LWGNDNTPVVFVYEPAGHITQTPGLIIADPGGQPKQEVLPGKLVLPRGQDKHLVLSEEL
jgi:hypothetical protein